MNSVHIFLFLALQCSLVVSIKNWHINVENENLQRNLRVCCYQFESKYNFNLTVYTKYVIIDVRFAEPDSIVTTYNSEKKRLDSEFIETSLPIGLLMNADNQGNYKFLANLNISLVISTYPNISSVLVVPNLSNPQFILACQNSHLQSTYPLHSPLTGLFVNIVDPEPIRLKIGILAFIMLKSMSLISIISAAFLVLRNHDTLYKMVLEMRSESSSDSSCSKYMFSILFFSCSIGIIFLSFYFYDIMVYFFISIFVIFGATSISFVCFKFLTEVTPKFNEYYFTIMRKKIFIFNFVLIFPALAFTITWCVYRNNTDVGWIMQDIIGIFIIIKILYEISTCVSFKLIIVGFTAFVCYDVFFVFITPYFFKSSASELPSFTSTYIQKVVLDMKPSSDSIMEAVATGSAGKSGELMPLVFKISLKTLFPSIFEVCSEERGYILMGFGDTVLPGILCVFCAFYDGCLKNKIPEHFIAAIVGYLLGGIVVGIVLFVTTYAQPALLYLCPFTLSTVLMWVWMRGGIRAIKQLWAFQLLSPRVVQQPVYPDNEFKYLSGAADL